MKIEIETQDSLPVALTGSTKCTHLLTHEHRQTGTRRTDWTETGSVLWFIKFLWRSMCEFHRELNVHKSMTVFCLTQSHSLSRWLKSEFSYWRVHLDKMNNFALNAGMKRKWPYSGMQPLCVRLVLSAWPCVCSCECVYVCVTNSENVNI